MDVRRGAASCRRIRTGLDISAICAARFESCPGGNLALQAAPHSGGRFEQGRYVQCAVCTGAARGTTRPRPPAQSRRSHASDGFRQSRHLIRRGAWLTRRVFGREKGACAPFLLRGRRDGESDSARAVLAGIVDHGDSRSRRIERRHRTDKRLRLHVGQHCPVHEAELLDAVVGA